MIFTRNPLMQFTAEMACCEAMCLINHLMVLLPELLSRKGEE